MGSQPLGGRVALVTGGGSGLGAAFVRRLAADGATVVVNDLDGHSAERVAAEVGGTSAPFDVGDPAAFDRAVDDLVDRHGALHILVNNAGIAPPPDPDRLPLTVANAIARAEGRIDEMVPTDVTVRLSDAAWDLMIRTHLSGTFYGTRAALRHMTPAGDGSIINVSSVLGQRPVAGAPHYAAAKAGIIAFTKSVGQEVAPFGVRVNVVCPGWIDTPLLAPMDPLVIGAITQQIPRGRLGRAEEIAEMVRFLAGPESTYCNGDVFTASGGFV